MLDIIRTAGYISKRYMVDFHKEIDEMKLHRLLYLSQRESIVMSGSLLFDQSFEVWKFGPVSPDVRCVFHSHDLSESLSDNELFPYLNVFDFVFSHYAPMSSWSLSSLSHGELSWQRARRRKASNPKASAVMLIDDIAADASRIRLRRHMLSRHGQFNLKTLNFGI